MHVDRRLGLLPVVLMAFALTSCSLNGVGQPSSANAVPTSTPNAKLTDAVGPSTQTDLLAEQTVNQVNPSVVEVINVGKGLGSGEIITPDGYIVTNHHVVAGETSLQVSLADGSTVPARLVGNDTSDDLAVVKISGTSLPAVTFGDSSKLVVGETVMAIGNPLGIKQTVTEGIVSALNRTVNEGQGGGIIRRAIQTSAPINPGNSGGALVDLKGNVVGIPTLTAVDPEFGTPANGIGFAIPANTVIAVTAQLIKYHQVIHTAQAALGIGGLSVTPTLATEYNLRRSDGVLVARVAQGGAASRAGMKAGEIIFRMDSTPIANETALLDALSSKNPGEAISVTVVDTKGKQHTYRFTLGKVNANSNE